MAIIIGVSSLPVSSKECIFGDTAKRDYRLQSQ